MRLKFEKDTNIGARTIGTDACVFLIGQARSAGMSAMPESGSEPEGVAFSRVTNGAHRFQAGVLGDRGANAESVATLSKCPPFAPAYVRHRSNR